jgi:hypothetical protein
VTGFPGDCRPIGFTLPFFFAAAAGGIDFWGLLRAAFF